MNKQDKKKNGNRQFKPFTEADHEEFFGCEEEAVVCRTAITIDGEERAAIITVDEMTDEYDEANVASRVIIRLMNGKETFTASVQGKIVAALKLICEVDLNNVTSAELEGFGFIHNMEFSL